MDARKKLKIIIFGFIITILHKTQYLPNLSERTLYQSINNTARYMSAPGIVLEYINKISPLIVQVCPVRLPEAEGLYLHLPSNGNKGWKENKKVRKQIFSPISLRSYLKTSLFHCIQNICIETKILEYLNYKYSDHSNLTTLFYLNFTTYSCSIYLESIRSHTGSRQQRIIVALRKSNGKYTWFVRYLTVSGQPMKQYCANYLESIRRRFWTNYLESTRSHTGSRYVYQSISALRYGISECLWRMRYYTVLCQSANNFHSNYLGSIRILTGS